MKKRNYYLLLGFLLTSSWLIGQAINNPFEDSYWTRSIEGNDPFASTIGYFGTDTLFVAETIDSEFFPAYKYEVLSTDSIRFEHISGICGLTTSHYTYKFVLEEAVFDLLIDSCEFGSGPFEIFTYQALNITLPPIEVNESEFISFFDENGIEGLIDYESNVFRWSPPYHLYDIDGNLLQSGEIYYPRGQLDFKDYQNGVYYLSILRPKGWETIVLTNFDFKTSIEEWGNAENFSLYPNPSPNGIFSFDYQGKDLHACYRIYDSNGKFIKEGNLLEQGIIDLSQIAANMYILIIQDDTGIGTYQLMK